PTVPREAQSWPSSQAMPRPTKTPPAPSPPPVGAESGANEQSDAGPPPLPFADQGAVLPSLRDASTRDEAVRHGLRALRRRARRDRRREAGWLSRLGVQCRVR